MGSQARAQGALPRRPSAPSDCDASAGSVTTGRSVDSFTRARRCVGISVSSVRHRVIDELDIFIDHSEQRLLVLPPADGQAPRVGL